MKTYYDFHEVVYQLIKEEGGISWDDAIEIDELGDPDTIEYLQETLQEWMPDATGKAALDLGCGTGPTAFLLARQGFKVTGIDVSETALQMARELSEKQSLEITFKNADALRLTDLKQSFDLIYDSHCLHCIVFEEDRDKVLKGAKALLNESGIFILDTMVMPEIKNWDATGGVPSLRFDENHILWHKTAPEVAYGIVQHEGAFWCAQRRIYPPEKVLEEVEAAGFKVLDEILEEQGDEEPEMLRLVLA